jgi:uncharacterized membrane protein
VHIKHVHILLGVIIISIALVLIIRFIPDNASRFILGIPFVLLLPGYTLIMTLFPGKEKFYGNEKLFFSFGLSLAVVPLICLILNFTSGLTLDYVLYALTGFVIIFSIIAIIRQHGLPDEENNCFAVNFRWFNGRSTAEIILSFILILVACGTIGVLVYVIAVPKTGSAYTEFYLLNSQGVADDYPSEIRIGDTESVIPVVINHENRTADYRIEIQIDNDPDDNIDAVILDTIDNINLYDDEKYQTPAPFTLQSTGDGQKLYFILFMDGETEPYLKLSLTINVY